MRKDTVTYKDFDGVERTEELYFNVSKVEITDNLDLQDELEAVLDMFRSAASEGGESFTLSRPQIEKYLALVKRVMRLSYGVRSADGKHFRKNEENWENFKDTAVYDAFLWSLFVEPEKANDFLIGVLPQDLREEAMAEVANRKPDVPNAGVEWDIDKNMSVEDAKLLEMDPRTMSKEQMQRAMVLRFGS